MSGPDDARGKQGRHQVPASALDCHRRHVDPRRQRGPGHPAIAQAQQLQGRHSSGRPERRADRRTAGAEKPRTTAGGRGPCGVHAAGGRRAGGGRGLHQAQGRLGDDLRRGLRRGRRAADAGRHREDRARRRARHHRPELPRRHQQRRRHHAAHAVRAGGVALRQGFETGACLRRPERRHARPFPARSRCARHAVVLCDLDRQRDRPRVHRLHRIPGRRPGDQRARGLHRAGAPSARIPRGDPALPRQRQAGGPDVPRPQRKVAAGRAVAHRRAGRRLRHHEDSGRGCRRHRRHHDGRNDRPRRNPGAIPEAAGQRPRHPDRVGRLRRPRQRHGGGTRVRISASRARDAQAVRGDPAALRQLRQSARRHRGLHAGFAACGDEGADRRSEYRHVVHFVSDPHGRGRAGLQQRHGALRQAEGSGRARRHLAARPRCHGSGEAGPRGVQPLVGPDDARDRALYAVRPPARPSARAEARADQGPAEDRQGHAAGMARQEDPGGRRHPRARRRTRPQRRRGGRGRQAHRLSGGAEGAGRGAVAQDRSRRRDPQSCRRGGGAHRLRHAGQERQARRAERHARRRARREDVAQGRRADGRRQARSRLGHGAAAGPWRHLGRGAGRRAIAAGRTRPRTRSSKRSASSAPRSF